MCTLKTLRIQEKTQVLVIDMYFIKHFKQIHSKSSLLLFTLNTRVVVLTLSIPMAYFPYYFTIRETEHLLYPLWSFRYFCRNTPLKDQNNTLIYSFAFFFHNTLLIENIIGFSRRHREGRWCQ